ncbi:response regulator [Fuerstiella marisgermanici]|uniref:Response regulator rcp1 n=1 Tax=Fuerstiella marisgermanici TaxID=1891926 RepID=A0A1P8WHF3_9PLAN|nr:response regulator [Fuerstiella marisgermanici]APZ93457.1 Response regulator rcp1 [Fuerstiella marisgermanici]
MTQDRCHEILLVEDSPSDAMLAMQGLSESSFASRVSHAKDGVEALAMLRREDPHSDCPRPDLIFLDLNMPRKDGRQVLNELRRDSDLTKIPVVVLSTSADETDIHDCYGLGSNSYIVKPVELQDFFHALERTQDYWFRTCAMPRLS